MSTAEQLEDLGGGPPPRRDALLEEEAFIEAGLTQPAKSSAKLRRYWRWRPTSRVTAAGAGLPSSRCTIAAITTLIVPVAVRRMIDFGFSPEGIAMINNYFSVNDRCLSRCWPGPARRGSILVMTIGERIVADLRRDVFAHLIALSPAFFDSARSGETGVAADCRYHPDQIRGRASVSVALRNRCLFHRRHHHDGDHEPKLSVLCCWRSR